MVPLNGDKNVGEGARAVFRRGRLSRLEECKTRGSKAVRSWTLSLQPRWSKLCVPLHAFSWGAERSG